MLTEVGGQEASVEIYFIPVSLALGVALIYFGVHGLPAPLQEFVAASFSRSGDVDADALDDEEEAPTMSTARHSASKPEAMALTKDDILLVDLMNEMLAQRAELDALRSQLTHEAPAPETMQRQAAPPRRLNRRSRALAS